MTESPRYGSFGEYLRGQRRLADLSLRQLAELTKVSNPYLSQLERGLHQPSVAVLKSLSDALNVSFDMLLAQVAGTKATPDSADGKDDTVQLDTEAAIRNDPNVNDGQKAALLSVYRSMVTEA